MEATVLTRTTVHFPYFYSITTTEVSKLVSRVPSVQWPLYLRLDGMNEMSEVVSGLRSFAVSVRVSSILFSVAWLRAEKEGQP